MSIEVFEMNSNGAGWVALENSTKKLEIELALMTNAEIVVRDLSIPQIRTCKVCELAHEGLYCTNCFTGERVRVGTRKFSKVFRLHEINK